VRNAMGDTLCRATLPSWTNFNVEIPYDDFKWTVSLFTGT
jgi:hypothetical protein